MTWRRIGYSLATLATILLAMATILEWFWLFVAANLNSTETPGSIIAEADLVVSTPLIVTLCAWGVWFRLRQAMMWQQIGRFMVMASRPSSCWRLLCSWHVF
jgi:hypothetical protein